MSDCEARACGQETSTQSSKSAENRPGSSTAGWSLAGIAVAVVVIDSAFAAISALVVPLVIAVVIGVLGVPAVDILERTLIPRHIGAGLFMVILLVVVGGSIGLAIEGIAVILLVVILVVQNVVQPSWATSPLATDFGSTRLPRCLRRSSAQRSPACSAQCCPHSSSPSSSPLRTVCGPHKPNSPRTLPDEHCHGC